MDPDADNINTNTCIGSIQQDKSNALHTGPNTAPLMKADFAQSPPPCSPVISYPAVFTSANYIQPSDVRLDWNIHSKGYLSLDRF